MGFLLDHLPRAGAPGDRQPGRPAAAARPAAGPGRAGRGTRGRPAVHRRRGGGVLRRRWACSSTAGDVAALEGRTEGWVAALQLAALSLRGRDDVGRLHRGVRGRRPVRRRLPRRGGGATPARGRPRVPARDLDPGPAVRAAVRRGHRPARRPGDARGARPGQPVPGAARRPPPVVPLPPPVRRRAAAHGSSTSTPTQVPDLHRRASAWHEQAGDTTVAIEHALAAGDSDRAAGLVERVIPALTKQRREAQLRALDGGAPRGGRSPRDRCWRTATSAPSCPPARSAGVEPRLRIAEQLGGGGASRTCRHAPRPGCSSRCPTSPQLPGWIEIHRAGLALMVGDVSATVDRAREAIDRARPGRRPGSRRGDRADGAGVVAPGRRRGRRGGVRRDHAAVRARGLRRRRPRLRRSRWPTLQLDPGPAPGRGAYLPRRARPRPRARRPGPSAGPRTCTSG